MSVSPTAPDGTKRTRPGFPVSGRLSLDLTWTLRYRSVWPTELLTSPDDLGADGSHRLVSPPGREAPAALSLIARDAIELLTCHDGRLRRCEGPMCGLLFHDASRPGNRRWCTTSRCGNKVNTKAYRTRQRSTEQ